MGNITGLLLKI